MFLPVLPSFAATLSSWMQSVKNYVKLCTLLCKATATTLQRRYSPYASFLCRIVLFCCYTSTSDPQNSTSVFISMYACAYVWRPGEASCGLMVCRYTTSKYTNTHTITQFTQRRVIVYCAKSYNLI